MTFNGKNALTNLRGRIRKREVRLTDTNGVVPNSKQWVTHWDRKIDQVIAGEDPYEGDRSLAGILRSRFHRIVKPGDQVETPARQSG